MTRLNFPSIRLGKSVKCNIKVSLRKFTIGPIEPSVFFSLFLVPVVVVVVAFQTRHIRYCATKISIFDQGLLCVYIYKYIYLILSQDSIYKGTLFTWTKTDKVAMS